MEEIKNHLTCSPRLFSDKPRAPWLITSSKDKKNQTVIRRMFYNLSERSYHKTQVQELHNQSVLDCAFGGWLLLKSYVGTAYCVLNLITLQKVQLPAPLPDIRGWPAGWTLVMPLALTDPNFRVIIYSFTACGKDRVISFKPGAESYDDQQVNPEGGFLSSTATLEGKVYGLLMPNQDLVVCDTIDEPWRFRDVGMRRADCQLGRGFGMLVESCGDLLVVVRERDGNDFLENTIFSVYQADFENMTWFRSDNIGKRAIFMQHGRRCYSCSTDGLQGIEDNCVYYTLDSDRNIYIFNLEDQSFSSFLSCSTITSQLKQRWLIT